MKRSLLMLALVLVALPVIAGENMQQVRKIGEEVTLAAPLRASGFASPVAEEPELAWRIELRHPDAEYVAPHFARFALPADAYLIVSSPDGARSWRYTADDNKRLEVSPEGFWGIHIYGEVAVVEPLRARADRTECGRDRPLRARLSRVGNAGRGEAARRA